MRCTKNVTTDGVGITTLCVMVLETYENASLFAAHPPIDGTPPLQPAFVWPAHPCTPEANVGFVSKFCADALTGENQASTATGKKIIALVSFLLGVRRFTS